MNAHRVQLAVQIYTSMMANPEFWRNEVIKIQPDLAEAETVKLLAVAAHAAAQEFASFTAFLDKTEAEQTQANLESLNE